VVVLDVSWSMYAETPRNRLTRAKQALLDLCDTVQRRGGHRLALVVFAARPRVDCPLTHDYDHFRDALEQLDLDAPPPDLLPSEQEKDQSGTRLSKALRNALAAHNNPDFQGAQTVLLISDGDDPVGGDDWESAAADARKLGIPIHTVGVGDPEVKHRIPIDDGYLSYRGQDIWTRLEEKPLERIAELSGGTYTKAHTKDLPLGDLFRRRLEPGEVRETSEDSLPLYRLRYAYFLGPALALLALGLAIRDRPPVRRPRSTPPAAGEGPSRRQANVVRPVRPGRRELQTVEVSS
jgi:Ca-activated chloride channel family protein